MKLLIIFLLAVGEAAAQSGESPQALIEAGHFKRAQSIVEVQLKANANDARAVWLLSRIRAAYRDVDGATTLAEKAVALEPRNADYHEQLADTLCEATDRASMFKALGLGKRCKKELETALELNPKHLDSMDALMGFLWHAPGMAGGDKNKAHEMAKRMEQIDREKGYLAEARLARLEKDTARQREYYEKAVEARPTSYVAQAVLANFYLADSQRKYDLAEQHAREALKINPGRSAAYGILARVHANQGRWSELEAILTQAEKMVPDNFGPYFVAANTLLAQGKELGRAEAWFRKYLSQEPEGNAPTHGVARWRLGLVLEKEGRVKEAAEQIEAALRVDPSNKTIKDDLKRVKRSGPR